MPKVLKDSFQQLYEIADSQSGYFTAKQALVAGYSDRMQTYHVQAGDWERDLRGIYRLRYYNNSRPDDLMLWYLWSSNRAGKPQGIYSYDTALELHNLSTWCSSKLHITVPRNFRRSNIPDALKLHYGELRSYEITTIKQVPVTTALRTILDLLLANYLQRHHLLEAMQAARKRGSILPCDLTNPWLTEEERILLVELERESRTYQPEA
jgi:predicted transcriptional regulator of viral defense system